MSSGANIAETGEFLLISKVVNFTHEIQKFSFRNKNYMHELENSILKAQIDNLYKHKEKDKTR